MLRSIRNAEATGPMISGATNRETIAGPLMGMGQLPVPSSRVELFHAMPTNTTTPRYSQGCGFRDHAIGAIRFWSPATASRASSYLQVVIRRNAGDRRPFADIQSCTISNARGGHES